MPLNLTGIFNPRGYERDAQIANRRAQQMGLRQSAAAAQAGGAAVNPAAAARAQQDQITSLQAQAAGRMQQALAQDRAAVAEGVQGLVGTGLSLVGTIGGMATGAGAAKGAGGIAESVAPLVSQASQPTAATGSVSPGGTHPVVAPTVSQPQALPMPLTPRAEGTGQGISNEALERIIAGPSPAAQPSAQDVSARQGAMSIIGNMGGLDPSSTEEMQRRQNLLWGPGGSYNRIWGR